MSNMDMEKLLIAEQAAAWLIRLEDATPQEEQEFLDWLKQSPLHVREVLAAEACRVELRHLLRRKRIDVAALVRAAADNVRELAPRDRPHIQHDPSRADSTRGAASSKSTRTARNPGRWLRAAAAFLILIVVAAAVTIHERPNGDVTTAAGEWQTRTLDDGTILRAGPRTKVLIEFTNERRLVRLVHGEALFHVAKNADRPFLVETDSTSARAVGTAFAVSIDGDREIVTVKEGIVDVARRLSESGRASAGSAWQQTVTLQAGQQVAVSATEPLDAKNVNVDVALAWANGQLIFERETVAQAVHEFNRRNELQMRVLDPVLMKRAVRGLFEAADPKSFAAFLEKQRAVSLLDEAAGTLTITSRPDATASEAVQ